MNTLKYFFVALIAVGGTVFFLFFLNQNDQRVRLCLANYCTREGLLSGYILLSFLCGMIFAGVLFLIPLLKTKAQKMYLRKQIKKQEKEIQELRNQPLEDLPQNQNVEVAKLVEKDEDETQSDPPRLQNP